MMGYNVQEHDYLAHHGVKGMRWGVRKSTMAIGKKIATGSLKMKQKEKEMQDKISNMGKNKTLNNSDRKRLAYRQEHISKRIMREATNAAAQVMLADIMNSKSDYSKMPKDDINKRLLGIAKVTAINVSTKTALANRAAKNYNPDGTLKAGVKRGLVTQEDILAQVPTLSRAAYRSAKLGRSLIGMQAQAARNSRADNEYNYKSKARSGLVLESRVDNVIWKSEDGKTTVIDNPRSGSKNITPRKTK